MSEARAQILNGIRHSLKRGELAGPARQDVEARLARPPRGPAVARAAALDQAGKVAVGSSRVDLQACKLEYSIVSPK